MSGGTGPVGNHRRAARLSGLQLVDQLVHAGVALAEPLHSRAVTAWPASPTRLMATPVWRASLVVDARRRDQLSNNFDQRQFDDKHAGKRPQTRSRPRSMTGSAGHEAIEVVVEDFYVRVLADDQLSGFFTGTTWTASRANRSSSSRPPSAGPSPTRARRWAGASGPRHHHAPLQLGRRALGRRARCRGGPVGDGDRDTRCHRAAGRPDRVGGGEGLRR